MRIPSHWSRQDYTGPDHKGKEKTYSAWGWSFESLSKAKDEAVARAQRVFEAVTGGGQPDSYDYLENPLREEIVESVQQDGQEVAAITRNRYGALVLNTASVCFVDVDFPEFESQGLLDSIALMFSPSKKRARLKARRQRTIDRLKGWFEGNPGRSFRLYETAAGARLLFTDRLYDPASADVAGLFGELGSDKLYRRLTVKQECFRARLTPKPWRCGCKRPPNRYPWETSKAEEKYRAWQRDYESESEGYGICRLVEVLGDACGDETISGIVSLHDEYTCFDGEAELA